MIQTKSILDLDCPYCCKELVWESLWDRHGTKHSITRCCGHYFVVRDFDSNFGIEANFYQKPIRSRKPLIQVIGLGILAILLMPFFYFSLPDIGYTE